MMPIVLFLAIAIFSWLIGSGVLYGLIGPANGARRGDHLVATLLGFIVLSLLYCVLGLLGRLEKVPFIAACLALAVASVVGLKLRQVHLSEFLNIRGRRFNWTDLMLATLLPVTLLGVTVATLPPLNWDEISYALTFPKLHIAAGNVQYLTQYGIFSAFPLFGETPIGIAYLLRPDPTGAHFTVLSFLALSLILIYRMARQISLTRFSAWLCVIAIAYLPLTTGNIGTVKIEPYQLAYILAAFYMLMRYRDSEQDSDRLLSYVFIGFAAGIKYTTIFAAPLYMCAYMMANPVKGGMGLHVREIVRLVLVGLAINAIWLLVNWINVCNPFFPNLVSVFGQCLRYPVTKDIMDMVMEGTMLQKGTSWATTHSLANFRAMFVAGFGLINTLLLVVSLGLFVVVRSLRVQLHLRWIFSGIVLTLMVQAFAIYWEFRYTYFAFSFFVLLIVAVAQSVARYLPLLVMIVGLIGFQAFQSWTGYFQHSPAVGLVMRGDIPREGYPDKFVHLYWVAKWINENTPQDAVIAFNWGVQPFYYLDRTFFFLHDWNPEENIQLFEHARQLRQALRNQHASYLVWRNQDDSGYIDPSKSKGFRSRMNGFVAEMQKEGVLKLVHTRDDVNIYAILDSGE